MGLDTKTPRGYRKAWNGSLKPAVDTATKNDLQRFTLLPQHVTLLRAANIGWDGCEFGAPAVDCKRPYGNGSVIQDIAEILGIDNEDERMTDTLHELHKETQTALQVILATGSFDPGDYVADRYSRNWRKA